MKLHDALALAGAVVAAASGGCSGVADLSNDEPCKNVGYSIASRTLDCTSDPVRANARYESFRGSTTCIVTQASEVDFECAISVNEATCEDVAMYADDIDLWLSRSASCATILTHADGSAIGVAPNAP